MIEIKKDKFKIRLVVENDAEFILNLRTDENLNKYLSKTDLELESQKKWIREYKIREEKKEEYYFIAENYAGERLGLTRLYNFTENSFEIGSWIFKRGLPEAIAILADIAARDFAFDELGFKKCKFVVSKGNKPVVQYHKLYKPELVDEDSDNFYFELDYSVYIQNKQKILTILNHE